MIDTWNNIIDIKFGFIHSLGLTSDGKVLAAGSNEELGMNVADWEDIVSIDCSNHSIGLKDGTVLASGKIETENAMFLIGKILNL